jgi:hypothetical protein
MHSVFLGWNEEAKLPIDKHDIRFTEEKIRCEERPELVV